ncbi:MAG TPA: membrane-bound PQQ-dependent dehydrogenase, glucose/quinate/shikimate family, partial [Devosia sp.]|nr:membrane-bound PQQ-dependent dehydrogenase, glucose/quinate/shikimate family [Devosia sp.]
MGFWWTMLVGVVLLVFGLPIAAGGLWLITLGGSWYYLPAGIGLLLTAWFLFQRSLNALWIYLVTYVATVIWALWEAGLDGWAQVPRLLAPTIVLILVLTTAPMLRGPVRRFGQAAAAGLVLAGALGVAGIANHGVQTSLAQEVEEPAQPTPEPATPPAEAAPDLSAAPAGPAYVTLETGADWPAYG